MDKETASKILLRQGWLSQTPKPFQRVVLEKCLLERFKAGTPIYSVGDEAGGMFGLVSGGLGISISPRNAGPYTAHYAMPGTWFGEASVFTRQPRRIGLTATRDAELLRLPLRAIDEIIRKDPYKWRFFGLAMVGHLDLALGGSDDLMIRDHVKRFVAVLLRLGNCRLANPQIQLPIEIDVKHEELAHMANVARTTAGTILRKLEAEGYLTLSYRRISILVPDPLRKMLRD